MSALSSPRIESAVAINDSVFELRNPQSAAFQAGTRTGDWFAVGDVHPEILPPASLPPPSEAAARRPSTARRTFARLVGCIAIAGTLAGLLLLATRPQFRHAVLDWSSFGRGDRLMSKGTR
jgi:hypothetical protein